MKKILSVIVVFTMLFHITASAQGFSVGIMDSMGSLKKEFKDRNNQTVYRDEFASIVAAMAGIRTEGTIDTVFSDVTVENEYSKAVQAVYDAGLMSGVGASEFAPDNPVTGQQAITAFIRLLDYTAIAESYGAWPDGYMKMAQRLDLLKVFSVPVTQPMIYKDLWNLCDAVMETNMTQRNYISGEDLINEELYLSDENPTYMNEALGIYKYEGIVESVDVVKHTCAFKVTESESFSSHMKGEILTLSVSTTINILEYDKAPVEAYVDSELRLLHIQPVKNTKIGYGVIYSVNGDEREGIKYSPNSISKIMLLDDKTQYKTANDFALYHNGVKTDSSLDIAGRYARIISINNEISVIDVWDMAEGGLVTETNYNKIVFRKGETVQRITDLDLCEYRMLIIDGECRDFSELKTDTLFDYYLDSGKGIIIIFASEKKVSDIFVSRGEDTIEIGNISFLRSEGVYASLDGEEYALKNFDKLVNEKITAYVDVRGRVRYIRFAEGIIADNTFTGYFMGYETAALSNKPDKFRVINLDDENFEDSIYPVSKKFSTEENLLEVYSTAGLKDGSAVYEFELNDSGEIRSLEKKTAFYGFEDSNGEAKTSSIGSFPQSAFPFMWVGGKRLYFDNDVKIVGLFEKDGEIAFKECSWNILSGRNCDDDVTAYFYGEEKSSDVDMILMTGSLSSIAPSENSYGVITKILNVNLGDGEIGKQIFVNNENSYILKEEAAEGLVKNTFVAYSSGTIFGESEAYVLDKIALDGNIDEWVGLRAGNIEIKRGTVEKIDEKRIYFTDGFAQFINQAQPLFFKVENTDTLINASYMDVFENKEIVYIADNNLIYAVFFE